MGKELFAGPWVGEFGWELFTWQAYVRHQAKNYDHITVCSRSDRAFLYEDFADTFVPLNYKIPKKTSMWGENKLPQTFKYPKSDVTWLIPYKILAPIRNIKMHDKSLSTLQTFMPDDQEFIKFGKKNFQKHYDFIIHARNRILMPEKNWATENYVKFISMFPGKTFASIGTVEEARHVPGTDDLRGIELKELANILASSELMISPSDGAINFGALCGIPRLVWSGTVDMEKNVDRHIHSWNPFNAPAHVFEAGQQWQLTANKLYRETLQFLDKIK